ncbi:MAG TPA: hypothetical protein VNS29_15260 [Burkholderiaceae bacterium]|nr:hypothetical protein [Burkholderiaceae bacterium]
MCGGPSLPPATDPRAERERAEAEATAAANAKAAEARRAKRNQSLLAAGAQGSTAAANASTVLAMGKDKLGG